MRALRQECEHSEDREHREECEECDANTDSNSVRWSVRWHIVLEWDSEHQRVSESAAVLLMVL